MSTNTDQDVSECWTVGKQWRLVSGVRDTLSRRKYLHATGIAVLLATTVLSTTIATSSVAQSKSLDNSIESIRGEKNVLQLVVNNEIQLKENLETLGDPTSVVRLENGSFVVVSKSISAVIVYDQLGRQVKKIGRWGEGPFEYVAPSVARLDGDRLVVLDSGTLKFIVYDSNGRGLEEWRGFTRAMSEFDVSNNVLTAFTSGSQDRFIMRVDRDTADTLRFAKGSLVSSALLAYAGNGRMGVRDGNAFYMYPNEAAVRQVNTTSGVEQVIDVPDSDWKSDTSTLPSRSFEEMNAALFDGRLVKYLIENSMALGVVVLDNYTVALIEDGIVEMEGQEAPRGQERELKYFVFDNGMKLIDTIRVNKSIRDAVGQAPLGTHGDSMIYVGAGSDASGSDIDWTLRQLRIERVQ